MGRLSDLADIHLGLPTDETIGTSTPMPNILAEFKKAASKRRIGYKGRGMCNLCFLRHTVNGENWCLHYNKRCNGVSGVCKGTK